MQDNLGWCHDINLLFGEWEMGGIEVVQTHHPARPSMGMIDSGGWWRFGRADAPLGKTLDGDD